MPYKDPERLREYQRQWMASRKAAWFSGKSCEACGSTSNLQLDHRDPAKKISHRIWSWSKPKREAELAKCRALCEPCHREKSATEKCFGEAVGTAKLTEQDALAILVSPVRPYRLLAEQYGVDASLVGLIKRRRIWRHLEDSPPAGHPVLKTGGGPEGPWGSAPQSSAHD